MDEWWRQCRGETPVYAGTLHEVMRVDVPAIVQAEVEQALEHMRRVAPVTDGLRHIKDAYLAARFGPPETPAADK